MILGILSDSHGHVPRTRAALQLLLDAGAEQIIHCGDIGGEAVLAEIAALTGPRKVPACAVLGNVDWEDIRLMNAFAGMGLRVLGRKGEIHLDGRKAAIVHGDDFPFSDRPLRAAPTPTCLPAIPMSPRTSGQVPPG
jgi:hypothetical protein